MWQAAILITMAHPAHVDILALVNLLASSLGRSDSESGSAASNSHSHSSTHELAPHHSDGVSKEECPLLAK